MIITLECKDCKKEFDVAEGSDEHYYGQHYRPSTKKQIWLCLGCRPKNPKVMHITLDGKIISPFRKKLQEIKEVLKKEKK